MTIRDDRSGPSTAWRRARRSSHRLPRRTFVLGGLIAPFVLADAPIVVCASQAEEREIEDAFGPVSMPEKPERIIAVRHHDIGNMLALGVVPVGIVPDVSEFPLPEQAAMLEGVANVRADADWMLDIEKAMALAPDLILEMSGQEGDPWNEETCALAKAAVTTLCFPYGYTTEDEIKQNLRNVGLALGLEDEAERLLADYDARVAELKAVVARADAGDKPVAHIFWQGDGNFFVPVDRSSNMLLESLGIAQPEFQADPTAGDVELSFENLALLNAADMVIVLLEGAGTQEELEASPVWQLLDPVRNGKVLFVDASLWGWEYIPVLMVMLDDIEQKLLPLLTTDQPDT